MPVKKTALNEIAHQAYCVHQGIGEHQCLLDFNDDSDATLFFEWIWSDGAKAFMKWREKRLKEEAGEKTV